MATNTTGFTQSKTIYVDFDQDRKPSLRDIGSDQIGANGAKEISFGFGSEDLSGHTVVLETKRVVDSGLKYAIASVYTDGTSTRYKVPLTSWFTTYRSALIMAVKVFNNNGVTIVDGEITEIDNDYLISVSDTFTLTVNYAPKATAVVPTFTASELELILATIAGKQDTANGIVVLQESDALPDVSDGTKNGWTYLKKNADYSYSIYKVEDSAFGLIQENLFKRVSFDTSTPETTLAIGTMAWSQEHRTIVFRVTDEVVLEINQEFVFDSKASGTVNNGYPVFFVEPQGDHAISKQATADDVIANPYGLRGIATETVSNNEFFKTTQLGRVDGVNTTNWALENGGSILYFDIEETGTGAYNMTTIKPTKPNQVIKMGSIEKWSTGGASNGRIIVRIDYGESLGTLHDVDLSGVATGDILRKTNGTWTPTSDLTDLEARTTVVESDITKIENGTTIVKKAEQDKNGNDIVDTYATKANTYTKTEVDNKVASVYKYKGSVDTFDDLPTIGLTVGDVYNVVDSGINYAWNGSEWDDIGGIEALATATNNGLMSKEDFSKLQALYDKATLDGLLGAKVDKTTTVNGKALSTNITLNKSDVGLGNVDNTSDVNKPISTAQQTALDLKANLTDLTAKKTSYDNTGSTLKSKNVQGAIDEHDREIEELKYAPIINKSYGDKINATTDFVPNANGKPLLKQVDGMQVYAPQLVTNGDFSNGTTGWDLRANTSQSVTNGINTITCTSTGNDIGIGRSNALSTAYTFYIYARINPQSSNNVSLADGGSGASFVVVANVWQYISGFRKPTDAIMRIYQNMTVGQTILVDYVGAINTDFLKTNKQYSPLYNTTFDLMTDAQIKVQMDSWVQLGVLPNANLQAITNTKVKTVGKNLFDKDSDENVIGYEIDQLGRLTAQPNWFTTSFIPVKPNTTYKRTNFGLAATFYDINNNFISGFANSNTTFTTPLGTCYIRLNAQIAAKDTCQLELGSTATTYAPYKSGTLELTHTPLYRLPNGVKDIVRYDNGQYVKDKYVGVDTVTGVVAVNTTNYPLAKTGGQFINIMSGSTEIGVIGTNSTTASGTLLYQLATPLLANELVNADGQLIQENPTTIIQEQTLPSLVNMDFTVDIKAQVIANKDAIASNYTALDNAKSDKVVLTNLVTNGDFSQPTNPFTYSSIVDNKLKVDNGANVFPTLNTTIPLTTNKYYYTFDIDIKTQLHTTNDSYFTFDGTLTGTDKTVQIITKEVGVKKYSGVNTFPADATGNIRIFFYIRRDGSLDQEIYIDNIQLINLTTIFGAGNEPTKEQMDAIMTLKGGYFSTATLNVIDVMKLFTPKTQEGWLTPTLVNGWIENGVGNTIRYMKDTLGFVHLRGGIKNGTAGSVIFTLPVGYRPSTYSIFPAVSNNALAVVLVDNGFITGSNGAVKLNLGSTATLTLDGITFKAEA